MWRCKCCGGTKFEIVKKIVDEDTGRKKSPLNIKDINGIVMCCKCYNRGEDINDIATWEDEYERD